MNPKSLKNLRSWQKGESGNPGGRPKRLLTEAYQAQLSRTKKRDRQRRTYAELIADAQIRKALKGNTMAAREIADRVEGKAGQAIELSVETPSKLNVRVHFVESDGNGGMKKVEDM